MLLGILLAIYIAISLIEFIYAANSEITCKSPSFLIEAIIDIIVSCFFIWMGVKLEKSYSATIKSKEEQISRDMQVSTDAASLVEEELVKLQESTRINLSKMWLIILSLTAVNIYSYLYSQIIFLAPDDACNYLKTKGNINAWNAWTIVDRMIEWVVWVIPIIYVFWPPNRTWYGATKDRTRRGSRDTYKRNYSSGLNTRKSNNI